MGLQPLRPSAAVCKVMTVPNSNCVRIVTPDEHVATGFHEILVYDMGMEEWPQVPLSEIGCLRLDWPKDLFAFVGRYQLELEQMRKACRDRFGPAASGTCPTCDKFVTFNVYKVSRPIHRGVSAAFWTTLNYDATCVARTVS